MPPPRASPGRQMRGGIPAHTDAQSPMLPSPEKRKYPAPMRRLIVVKSHKKYASRGRRTPAILIAIREIPAARKFTAVPAAATRRRAAAEIDSSPHSKCTDERTRGFRSEEHTSELQSQSNL